MFVFLSPSPSVVFNMLVCPSSPTLYHPLNCLIQMGFGILQVLLLLLIKHYELPLEISATPLSMSLESETA